MDSPTVTYCHIRSLCYEYGLIYSDIYTPSLQSFPTITPILPFLSRALLFSQMFLIVQHSPISQYALLVYCAALMDESIIIIVHKHLENRIQNTSRRCKSDRSSLYAQRWKDHIACVLFVSITLNPLVFVFIFVISISLIQVNDGFFTWGSNLSTLSDINIRIPTGTHRLLPIYSQTIYLSIYHT